MSKTKAANSSLASSKGGENTGITGGVVDNLRYFLPEEIEVEEIGDRILSPKDMQDVEELANSIEAVGQEQPCKVTMADRGELGIRPLLYVGRRRRMAIALINARKNKGENPLMVRCEVTEQAGDTFRKAVQENIHRKNYTAVEFALLVKAVRTKYEWPGEANTKYVAKFLQVDKATITESEKILELPEELIKRGHEEGLSANTLLTLAKGVLPEKRGKVLDDAKELAAQEEKDKAAKRTPAQQKKVEKKRQASGKAGTPAAPKPKHIKKAAEQNQAQVKDGPASKKEILAVFEEIEGSPAYGHANSPARSFCAQLMKFASTGKGERGLRDKFDALVFDEDGNLREEGTPSEAEKKAAKVVETAKKRTTKAAA